MLLDLIYCTLILTRLFTHVFSERRVFIGGHSKLNSNLKGFGVIAIVKLILGSPALKLDRQFRLLEMSERHANRVQYV